MKPAIAAMAASGRTYEMMSCLGGVASAAITSHSVLGVTRMFLTRSTMFISCLLPRSFFGALILNDALRLAYANLPLDACAPGRLLRWRRWRLLPAPASHTAPGPGLFHFALERELRQSGGRRNALPERRSRAPRGGRSARSQPPGRGV